MALSQAVLLIWEQLALPTSPVFFLLPTVAHHSMKLQLTVLSLRETPQRISCLAPLQQVLQSLPLSMSLVVHRLPPYPERVIMLSLLLETVQSVLPTANHLP